jgi:hypothetical protein
MPGRKRRKQNCHNRKFLKEMVRLKVLSRPESKLLRRRLRHGLPDRGEPTWLPMERVHLWAWAPHQMH